jgi:16S rRNA (guanine966-N2)-methyltransferase
LKESLFSFLGEDLENKVVCDLFSGSGSLGLEALSRGASRVIFVEQNRRALDCLRANITHLDLADFVEVIDDDVFSYLDTCRSGNLTFDIILADPDYESKDAERLLDILDKKPFLTSLLCIEHKRERSFDRKGCNCELVRTLSSSDKRVSVFLFGGKS